VEINQRIRKNLPKKRKMKKIMLAEREMNKIQMEKINKYSRKLQFKKLLPSQRNSFIYLFQRKTINQEFQVLNMKKLRELKMKSLNSKKRT
jgi:hypothetical protein